MPLSGEQLSLLPPELKAVDLRDPTGNRTPPLGRDWWAVRCPACREWLTKYDFTAEEALAIAQAALDRGEHRCRP